MSQTKAQLIQPIGVVTASGVVVSGVMTAGTFDGDVVGSATSVIQGSNLNLGAFNATSFAGDFTGNATGIITSSAISVGSLTASSFVGDFTGTATSMARGTGFKAGTVTATPADVTYTVTVSGGDFYLNSLQQPTPSLYPGATYTFDQSDSTNGTHPLRLATAADAAGSTEYTFQVTTNGTPGSAGAYTRIVVSPSAPDTLYYYCSSHSGMGGSINITNLLQGPVTGAVTGDVKGNIAGNITGNVTGNAVGSAGSVFSGSNIHVGVMTATSYSGDGSNMTGIAASNFNTQTVTANAAETIIDLSDGNMITMNQSANTTVGFASTSTAMDITIIRIKDANATARTITWPNNVNWTGGSAPTLISKSIAGDSQQFQFLTRDSGLTWYAWENYNRDLLSSELFAWGGNDGALGLNDRVKRSSPTQVGTDVNWNELSRTGEHTSATKTDGTLWAWGRNYFGALGLNQSFPGNDRSSPTQVPGTTWSTSAVHYRGVTSTKTDGTLWSWGYNNYGELGLNNRTYLSSPTQVGTDTTWAEVATAGVQVGAATKTDGTLWTWGDNRYGRLGQNITNTSDRSSPVQLPGTTWGTNLQSKVAAGGERVIWIKTDGTLWLWGNNAYGSLGLNQGQSNENNSRSSPTQLPGTTWNTTASCALAAIATKTDGTLWAWGLNEYGQLAQNHTTTTLSSPVQIPGTTWDTCGMGGERSLMATKTDGTMWCWGYNNNGMAGINNNINHSSPVQVPGTDWSLEGTTGTNNGSNHIFAFKKI